ncbi:hypothetical protein L7F22_055397 [Adiantum nelumboides]|nr:hypothetical protein [Adiantum nelumboides]
MASRSNSWFLRSGYSSATSRPFPRNSFVLLVALLLIVFAASSLLSSRSRFPLTKPKVLAAEHSFVKSLQSFLLKQSIRGGSGIVEEDMAVDVSTSIVEKDVLSASSAEVKDLDNAIDERERVGLLMAGGMNRPLKVYVYDMPRKFTYDLLQHFQATYKETFNLTSNGSPVHRLIEQHSIDYWLWADLLAPDSERFVKTVVRVFEQAEADIFYIPFFTTISFFLLEKRQRNLLYREALNWVRSQPAWQRSGGRDHVLPVHHPWSFKSHRRFMKHAIWLLPDLDSTGNWYKPGEVSLAKDVVLPYVPNVEPCDHHCMVQRVARRKTLLFFRGRMKRNAVSVFPFCCMYFLLLL